MKASAILCQLVLAGFLMTIIISPSSSQPRPKDRLTQTVDVKLDRVSTPDAVSQALLDAGVPGGISVVHYCGGFPTRSFKPAGRSVRALLDEVVTADPAYLWRVEQGVVNLVPRNLKIQFLETSVPRLELKESKSLDEALNILMALPEVQRQADRELGQRAIEGGAYAFTVSPTGEQRQQKTLSIALTDTTVAGALNAIAKAYGSAVWVLVKNECNNSGRKTFSIKFIYH